MNAELLQTFLDRHGADPARWPAHERATVERLIADDPEARRVFEKARRLDAALGGYGDTVASDDAALARLTAKLNGPLPPQKRPFWRLPAVLLDWQFAPAWPRMAALACCAVLGFAIGLTGVDRRFDSRATTTVSSSDVSSSVFAAEPFPGVQP
jgi:anti-sigma-K factor RskA